MSTKTQKLMIEFGRRGHLLGRAIRTEEVPGLIQALRQRLGCSTQELDLSPESLKRLEARLIALHQAVQTGEVSMGDEETVRFMRELTAYLGQVMVVNLNGEWEARIPTVWPTMVTIPLPVTTIKGSEIHRTSGRAFAAADNAAYFWDLIGSGEEKEFLWREYKAMTQKRWRERLS